MTNRASAPATQPGVVPARGVPPARRRRRRSAGQLGQRVVLYVLALMAFVFFAGPLLWMLSSALKSQAEVLASPPTLIPETLHWSNFAEVFRQIPFGRYMVNSAFVATTVTVLSLVFHSMAAYSLARLDFPGRNVIFVSILATLMIPFTVILIPLFIVVDQLGWVDTYWALIIPMIPHAFGIFLLRQFYLGLPRELEEAAIVDGASLIRVYTRIVLPLSRPILAALGIFFFLANWNRFLWPLIVTHDRDLYVVQLGMQQFSGERGTRFELIMAASTVAILPTLILFFVLQRRLIEGIKLTGLKG
ncbi:carbohydrate ABC transporter permease [Phytoactinopolyspora limicola]|uniref:carbohydrate ABC transporter permease n=1 Tax=Phytoactinopolyspora limicola TaxID=2715536 RepID=UPI00140D3CBB|nr:carbohydrate ABC transporter permease [Phytoactinopolyspora limicola]